MTSRLFVSSFATYFVTLFLTICSANYLAQAKTLADSVQQYHLSSRVVIGLVDRIPIVLSPSYSSPHELLPVEALAIPAFEAMSHKYNLVELNTAVKPFYIEHLYQRNAHVHEVIYLDPDVLVLGRFSKVLDHLVDYMLVVTPHCVTPSESPEAVTMELDMLKGGVYNLGFLGTSRKPRIFEFLHWWQRRLQEYCYYRLDIHLFVDQLWIVLAPHFFGSTYVENDLGYNVCYWNLYERTLDSNDGYYRINGITPVVFYHFSSFNPDRPAVMVGRYNTPFPRHSALRQLFDMYRARLLENDFEAVSKLPCAFAKIPVASAEVQGPFLPAKRFLQKVIRRFLRLIPTRIRALVERTARFVADNC